DGPGVRRSGNTTADDRCADDAVGADRRWGADLRGRRGVGGDGRRRRGAGEGGGVVAAGGGCVGRGGGAADGGSIQEPLVAVEAAAAAARVGGEGDVAAGAEGGR